MPSCMSRIGHRFQHFASVQQRLAPVLWMFGIVFMASLFPALDVAAEEPAPAAATATAGGTDQKSAASAPKKDNYFSLCWKETKFPPALSACIQKKTIEGLASVMKPFVETLKKYFDRDLIVENVAVLAHPDGSDKPTKVSAERDKFKCQMNTPFEVKTASPSVNAFFANFMGHFSDIKLNVGHTALFAVNAVQAFRSVVIGTLDKSLNLIEFMFKPKLNGNMNSKKEKKDFAKLAKTIARKLTQDQIMQVRALSQFCTGGVATLGSAIMEIPQMPMEVVKYVATFKPTDVPADKMDAFKKELSAAGSATGNRIKEDSKVVVDIAKNAKKELEELLKQVGEIQKLRKELDEAGQGMATAK